MSGVERLDGLYEVPDGAEVVFVGGPADGRRMRWSQSLVDSGVIVLPADPGPLPIGYFSPDWPPRPSFRVLEYRVVLDGLGWPSRADDGAVRFGFRGER